MIKKFILLSITVLLCVSCVNDNRTPQQKQIDFENSFETVNIDGCEYLFREQGYWSYLTIKANGNCGTVAGQKLKKKE